jgi:Tol biopolymer transport system component
VRYSIRRRAGRTAAAALVLAVAAAGAFAGLAAVRPAAGVPRPLTAVTGAGPGSNELSPRWSPSGRYLALERDDGTSRTIEVYAAGPDGAPRLAEAIALRPGGGGAGFLLESAGAQAPTFNAWPAWAADERRFAFVSNAGTGEYDLYLATLDAPGGPATITPLTRDGAADGQVAWSPAGDRLAFVSGRTDRGDLYLLDLASRQITRLTGEGRSVLHPEWSPDGRRLAFAIGDGDNHDVCVIEVPAAPVAPAKPRRPAAPAARVLRARLCLVTWAFDDVRPRWAPDGSRLAFYSSYNPDGDAGVWSLFTVDADGADPSRGDALLARRVDTGVVVDLEAGPAWTPDGHGLVYARRVAREFNPLYVADLAARTVRRLETGHAIHHDVAVARDGRLALRAQVARWDRVLVGRLDDLVADTEATR